MISIIIGIVGFWFCPESIEKAKWLTEEEKALALARVKSENVATTEVVEGLEIKPLFKAMTSFTTVAIAVIFLLDNIAAQVSSALAENTVISADMLFFAACRVNTRYCRVSCSVR